MYITLQSIKRNLGLFGLEISDIVLGTIFGGIFTILFTLSFYQAGIIVLVIGVLLLVPVNVSNKNRFYKLLLLTANYLFNPKTYYYFKDENHNSELMVKYFDKIERLGNKFFQR